MQDFKFLREAQVSVVTGLSKSTRWRLERSGMFPLRRKLAAKAVGWLATEIEEWVKSRRLAKTANIDLAHKNGN